LPLVTRTRAPGLNGRALPRNGSVTLINDTITAAYPTPASGCELPNAVLGSIRSSEAGSTLVSPPPSDWRVRALQISRDFQAHAGDPDRSDPDPATTVDPNPTATALERCARALSPAGYGGLYHRGSAYFVGFTGDVDLNLSRLHAAFPDVEVSAFLARHSWDELRRISHAITGLMTESSTAGHILSVGPDEVRNIVEVEVRDPGSVLAKSLLTQYGDAIVLVPGDLIELLSTATASIGSPSGLLGRPVRGPIRMTRRGG